MSKSIAQPVLRFRQSFLFSFLQNNLYTSLLFTTFAASKNL
ncbi:hypothetical protein HMPREF9073_01464 [Capnocytophaga sp. oral taxon 326 str. F0382]|nr:hypothetical protein HMPREF9073_01464 [Capnocytophaga sp. oral taxon 326 str. F0382]